MTNNHTPPYNGEGRARLGRARRGLARRGLAWQGEDVLMYGGKKQNGKTL